VNEVLNKEKPRRSGVFSFLSGGASRTVLTRRSTTRQQPDRDLDVSHGTACLSGSGYKAVAPMEELPLFQTAVHAHLLPAETARSIRRESVAITVRASAIGEYTENSIAAGECDD